MARGPGLASNNRDARRVLASVEVRRALRAAAERGVPAFRQAAPRRTGQFAARVTVEDSTGWDGRPAVRIVARSEGALAIEFGSKRHRGANALQKAIVAIERGR